ncbi:hypothetical protein ABID82_001134 [Methylobacterium sp. PvP062]|jgi:hypothetical protein|uniref:Uncharacterized protein n=2 Tax=Methylobacterium radiotolerans TaxID=31998 RepID=B1LSZ5_METRJ|nr:MULTISPECIES: hypothetical protein [Methylobacterium]MCX7334946.1 hypothetical protein [Hyphomicrobiales bacterium]GAN49434.1 hypothetical protein ME121_3462 [Methylobacterium sp. ME121]ACB26866.1 hypothetical protein Mrad2831_4906 [Methylobacterium radiotolerans JCM 2831]KTS12018.1 hypothetical protein SB3_02960 [Methylobacterium radiotolerans]KTS45011.1 hypothetical protein SB2_22385 [Methylobacterium radiotolerans]
MHRIRNGLRRRSVPPAPALPESLTRFVAPPVPETGWITAPLRDIGLALLVGLVVALVGGRILEAW